ncbi:MAG: nitric oxide reductase transcription regulator, partial [Proteobacteria bacterium]|nr:nitric oxide reductase transcription regulator [Pseudomonadota bacterium]
DRNAIVTLEAGLLDLDALEAPATGGAGAPASPAPAAPAAASPATGTLRDAVDACQRQVVTTALDRHQGNWAQAARALEVDPSNLHKLARRLGLKA